MAGGKFDEVEEEYSDFITSTVWAGSIPHRQDGSGIDMDRSRQNNVVDPTTTNTIAAVVSALLATTVLFLLVIIIRAIRKRRQQQQGNRLGVPVIHTITPSSFGATVAAYRNVPVAGRISWEDVTTSSAPVLNPDPL